MEPIKYIQVNPDKTPVGKWNLPENQFPSCDTLPSAGFVIPAGIVVVDFDGNNFDKNGIAHDEGIFTYIIREYKPYWVKSRQNHIHLYFKVPKGLEIKNWTKWMTLGGFEVDYKTKNAYVVIKTDGRFRDRPCELNEDVLNNLPILPSICYPLYCNSSNKNSFIGMVEHDGRDDAIFKHIGKAKSRYPNLDLKEPILFLNKLFLEPLDQNIVMEKINRVLPYSANQAFSQKVENTGPLKVVSLADINPSDVKYLWYPYIPLGTLIVVEGNPGSGKTFFTIYVCSKATTGEDFPNDSDNHLNVKIEPSNIIFQNGEDNISILKERFTNQGGDLTKILRIDESDMPFDLGQTAKIEDMIKEYHPKLIVIDPLQNYLPNGISMNQAKEMREVLGPIRALAEKYECTIIIIMHLNKSKKTKLYRGLGSVDSAAIARSILFVEDNKIEQVKNSFSEKGKTITFEISDSGFEITGNNLSPKEKAVDFLKSFLQDGYKKSKDIEQMAKESNISESTLKRAKKELKIISCQKNNCWYCCLNEEQYEALKNDFETLEKSEEVQQNSS